MATGYLPKARKNNFVYGADGSVGTFLYFSVHQSKENIDGATAQDVMSLVILTQYVNTLAEMRSSPAGHALGVNRWISTCPTFLN